MGKRKKAIINLIFLFVCFGATMHYVFHGQDFSRLLFFMKGANRWYWLAGIVCVIIFILSESVIIYYLMNTLNQKIKLSHCFLYSFVGFFFSLVTPSASGGQPVQIIFMKRDKIPIHLSTLVLMIVTITYKMVLVIFGIIVLTLRPIRIMGELNPVMFWMYLGMLLNIICIAAMLMLVFSPDLARNIVMFTFRIIKKMAKSKKVDAFEQRLEKSIDGYKSAALYFKEHHKVIINVFIITFIQRCALFFITYLVILSFGVTGVNFVDVQVLQAMIAMAVDMLPLPGGMGISEHLYQLIFMPILGVQLTLPTLIVSRGIGFYTQLFISAVFTVVAYLIIFRGKDRDDRIL